MRIYIKLCGAVLILAASYGIGAFIGADQRKRLSDIKELLQFTGILLGNLSYSAVEITDMIEQGARKTRGGVATWLAALSDRLRMEYQAPFETVWAESISCLQENSYLSKRQLEQVAELGKWLCYMDVGAQLQMIRTWEAQMKWEYEEQKSTSARVNRVSKPLGFLVGLFLVIVLL